MHILCHCILGAGSFLQSYVNIKYVHCVCSLAVGGTSTLAVIIIIISKTNELYDIFWVLTLS